MHICNAIANWIAVCRLLNKKKQWVSSVTGLCNSTSKYNLHYQSPDGLLEEVTNALQTKSKACKAQLGHNCQNLTLVLCIMEQVGLAPLCPLPTPLLLDRIFAITGHPNYWLVLIYTPSWTEELRVEECKATSPASAQTQTV